MIYSINNLQNCPVEKLLSSSAQVVIGGLEKLLEELIRGGAPDPCES